MSHPDPGAFMAAAPRSSYASAAPVGNTPWARAYAGELVRVIHAHAARAPRSNQAHIGPSEIGVACDRQVVGKLVGAPRTNHVVDPWPSIVGTAVHAWLADAFDAENERTGRPRWLTETRSEGIVGHPGTGDLFDAHEAAVGDWKILGESTLPDIRMGRLPRKYVVQLLTYARGFVRLGFVVRRVVLVALPRTKPDLSSMYVHEIPYDDTAEALLAEVEHDLRRRKALAEMVRLGALRLPDVAIAPDDHECYFCPFYRPGAARGDGEGCPGTVARST